MARIQPWKITVAYTSTRSGPMTMESIVESASGTGAADVVERDLLAHLREIRATDARIVSTTIAPAQTRETLPRGVRCGGCGVHGTVEATPDELILAPYPQK